MRDPKRSTIVIPDKNKIHHAFLSRPSAFHIIISINGCNPSCSLMYANICTTQRQCISMHIRAGAFGYATLYHPNNRIVQRNR